MEKINNIIELNNLKDNETKVIYINNNINNNKILKYKLMMENIIIEYHKLCEILLNE